MKLGLETTIKMNAFSGSQVKTELHTTRPLHNQCSNKMPHLVNVPNVTSEYNSIILKFKNDECIVKKQFAEVRNNNKLNAAKILKLVSEASDDILDDEELIVTLD